MKFERVSDKLWYINRSRLEIFIRHCLKITTCGKIVPVVVLLALSRQGIPCSKGK